MITVQVKLFASLRRFRPEVKMGESSSIQVPEGSTLGELIGLLGLPEDEVKVVFVNGLARGLEQVLTDGDEIGLFPPVGGG